MIRGASPGFSRSAALGGGRIDVGATGCGYRGSFRRTVLERKFLSWSLAAVGGFKPLS